MKITTPLLFLLICIFFVIASKTERIFECLHFENETPWITIKERRDSVEDDKRQSDKQQQQQQQQLIGNNSKISVDLNCDLVAGNCMPLGRGSRLFLDGVELTNYYHPHISFSTIYLTRESHYFEIFSIHFATPSTDGVHFLRVDVQLWFAIDPLEFGIYLIKYKHNNTNQIRTFHCFCFI
jgi:hypothetical protein